MNINSILDFQEIKDLSPVNNVLIYKETKIPCLCEWKETGHIKMICKTYLNIELMKEIPKSKIKINDYEFYISDDIKILPVDVGDCCQIEFTLTNINIIETQKIDLIDLIIGGE